MLLTPCQVTAEQLGAVEVFLRKVNPAAEIVCTSNSVLPPPALLTAARFNMQKAEEHPQWLKEAREHEHTPETLSGTLKASLRSAPAAQTRARQRLVLHRFLANIGAEAGAR